MVALTPKGNAVNQRSLTILSLGFLALVHTLSTRAENWNAWRGPRGDGSSVETNVPTDWGADTNIAWKVEVPGVGHASPIIWGNQIFLLTCLEEQQQRTLLCLDRRNGQQQWRRNVVTAPLEQKHPLNSYASSTPATDGRRVYVTFLDRDTMVVAAYTRDGKQCWKARPGTFSSKHGFCSCPVLFEDLVIVNGDHDGDAYIVALDRGDGSTRWKIDRPNKTRSYATPLIREIDGRTQMILPGNRCVASYDPRDGSQHWIIDGPTEQFVASIVFNGKLLFMTCGFPDHHILAIQPNGHGNITNTHIAWRTSRGASYVPSPIVEGEFFLLVSDSGVASCFDATTGERHWMKRIGRRYSAATVSAEGLVYFLSDDGETTVIRPGTKYDEVAHNKLGEATFASPAISGERIFIRGEKHLFCIGR